MVEKLMDKINMHIERANKDGVLEKTRLYRFSNEEFHCKF